MTSSPAAPPPWFFADALDYYGRCNVSPCICLKPRNPWLGRACQNWTPIGFRSHAEMMARASKTYEEL